MLTIITNVDKLRIRKMDKLIIHCSATPNGRKHEAAEIHKWHLDRGWNGIGYHWVITVDGKLQAGRPEYWMGSHASGHNSKSIGVCMIGTDEFSDEQWAMLKDLIHKKIIQYKGIKVIGHNEVSKKSCPGFDVQQYLRAIL